MRYDAESGHYVETTWDAAFQGIGEELRRLRSDDPRSVVFYASGRASLETSFMWQLLARLYVCGFRGRDRWPPECRKIYLDQLLGEA